MDLYALLGLQNERWTATDAQIKLGALPSFILLPKLQKKRQFSKCQSKRIAL